MHTRFLSKATALACFALATTLTQAQSWSTITNPPPVGVGLCMLLTHGGVMCQADLYNLPAWYKLTPDANGSYLNGTWSSLASMPLGYVPSAYASAVLADGRVVVVGGEYNNGGFALTNMGAIYDPKADAWTMLAPPSSSHFQCIGDAPSTVLADGRLIIGSKLYQDLAVLDPATLSWSIVSTTGKTDAMNSEEGWTLLPDGSFFTLDVKNAPASERFLLTGPTTGIWASSGNTPQDLHTPGSGSRNAPGCPTYYPPGEVGPTLLRPDGTVFAIGADGFTGIYTPPAAGSSGTGTWSEGPAFPQNVEDGPAAVLPNGHVLFGSSPGDSSPGLKYFEFDGAKLIDVQPPARAANDATESTSLLVLPTGEVMFVDGSTTVQLYTSTVSSTYNAAWAPTISNVPQTISPGATYQISGTQFNGLDQGSAYGDEMQNATNYPLVYVTNNQTKHVFYARTHDHSTMGVANGNTTVSTYFDVPAGIEAGPSTIQVVANGIPSTAVAITVAVAAGQAPAVTTGSPSDVTGSIATLNGSVNPDGADTQVWFEYSANSSMSGSVSTPRQDIGSGTNTQPFSANIAGLAGNATYYFQSWASNSGGTSHGSIASFTQTSGPEGYSDIGPDNSFSIHYWCVTGQNNTGCGPSALRQIAAPLTPNAAFTLRSISLALRYIGGTNSAQISLLQDAGGAPGNSLESWTVSDLPALPPALTTINDQLGLTLQAGQQYWVEVQPSATGTDTLLGWCVNYLGQDGALTDVDGSGWQALNGAGPAFNVLAVASPSVSPGGVVTASAFGEFPSVAPGSWIEIYGSNLAADTRDWAGSDFNGVSAPVELDGTSVAIGGQPAVVSFISPGQVNVQVPSNVSAGQQPLVVTTRAASSPYLVTVKAEQPGLLAPPSFKVGGNQYVVALFPDYSTYVLPSGAIAGISSRPAKPGDTIILYGVGFGAVTPTIPAGQLVGQSNTLVAPFQLFFGNTEANITYDGLAPGYVGLYQFNVVVPNISGGNVVPLTFTLAGTAGAQTLYIAVQ